VRRDYIVPLVLWQGKHGFGIISFRKLYRFESKLIIIVEYGGMITGIENFCLLAGVKYVWTFKVVNDKKKKGG